MSKSTHKASAKPQTSKSTSSQERKPVLSIIKDIQRQTRRQYSVEEKIATGRPEDCIGRITRRTIRSRDMSTRGP